MKKILAFLLVVLLFLTSCDLALDNIFNTEYLCYIRLLLFTAIRKDSGNFFGDVRLKYFLGGSF